MAAPATNLKMKDFRLAKISSGSGKWTCSTAAARSTGVGSSTTLMLSSCAIYFRDFLGEQSPDSARRQPQLTKYRRPIPETPQPCTPVKLVRYYNRIAGHEAGGSKVSS